MSLLRDVRIPGSDSLHHVSIANDKITSVSQKAMPAARIVDGAEQWVIPGWIDLQVNDMEWMDVCTRETTPDAHAARIKHIRDVHLRKGVTGIILATIASPMEILNPYLRGSATVLKEETSFHGCLVEGTFMNPECSGCHNKDYVYPPTQDLLTELISTEGVSMINIAPEMGDAEETLKVIQEAKRAGIVVATGHAKPNALTLRKAAQAGCSYIIHLGNASGSSLKSFNDGGMIEEALRNDSLTIGTIGDFIHVHPEILRDWIARKELHRVVAVSDQAFAAGLPPSNQFNVFNRTGCVSEDGSHLRVTDLNEVDVPTLFGSCVSMMKVFENLVNLFSRDMQGIYHRKHSQLSLPDAVANAVLLCSTNPAKLLGKDGKFGSLKPGLEANLLLINIEEKDGGRNEASRYQVSLSKVFYKGKEL
eukprot:m.180169 g.180169  ORF g.180169 m.180169 type:complete len:421 (+) comp39238_c0_seq3:238-1500(+)